MERLKDRILIIESDNKISSQILNSLKEISLSGKIISDLKMLEHYNNKISPILTIFDATDRGKLSFFINEIRNKKLQLNSVVLVVTEDLEDLLLEAIELGVKDYIFFDRLFDKLLKRVLKRALREIKLELDNESALSTLETKNNELSTLFLLSSHLRNAKSTNELLPIILRETTSLLGATKGAVLLFDHGVLTVNNYIGDLEDFGNRIGEFRDYFLSIIAKGVTRVDGFKCFIPLASRDVSLGLIYIEREEDANLTYSMSDISISHAIGEMSANAIYREQLHESSQKRMDQLQALRVIDSAITTNSKIENTLQIAISQICRIQDVEAGAVLKSKMGAKLEYAAWQGFGLSDLSSMKPFYSNFRDIYGESASSIIIKNLDVEEDRIRNEILVKAGKFQTYIAIPLIAHYRFYGILELFKSNNINPDHDWIKSLEALASQTAIAMDNDHLFSSLEMANRNLLRAYDATIEGWAYALDLRDQETEGHSRRVTELTLELAREMGVPEALMLNIKRGALLHDIGKMGVPDRILLKPGSLSDDEWHVMRKHPQYAWDMLNSIEYLKPALEIPYNHHEKWNGSGYPRGLSKEDIPLSARIFSIIDVYDALTSDRPYREPWDSDRAINYIISGSGSHFDPNVVTAFVRLMTSGKINEN